MKTHVATDKGQRFGKYALVERLGRGGMAEVWKARISGPGGFARTLVVKRILPHLIEDPHFVEMFVAEARLSARLNHANIVQVFELGEIGGEYFLAMEYVHGCDLVGVLRAQAAKGPPPPGLGAFVMREVCRALAYAHALSDERGRPLQLIHRDVSPANVMIGFDGAVKLLDFGIAKALAEAGESKTVTGMLKGKFGYMSPEQVEGRALDHRADLFAAGIVLHEALTGKRLFKGASEVHAIAMVREAKVAPPSLVNPAVPAELDDICMKALARDADARWRDCDEMAAALDDVVHRLKWGPERLAAMLRELFPDAPPQSQADLPVGDATIPQVPAARWRGRGRRGAIAAALAAVVVIGGVGLGWRSMKRRAAVATGSDRSTTAGSGAGPAGSGVGPGATGAKVTAATSETTAATSETTAAGTGTKAAGTRATPSPTAKPVSSTTAPGTPAQVTVRVLSSPADADVFVGKQRAPRGRTPMAFTVPRGEVPLRLTVRKKGYERAQADVVPDADSRLQMTLSKKSRGGARLRVPKPSPAAKPSPPPPDLHRGDVVDPFAR